jgi:predicted nucleic acid-binding protein
MIFIDSNIPMYLVGAAHPHKDDAQRLLAKFIADRTRLVTDAEVLQEILHRYAAIDRRDAIKPAFDAILGIVEEVYAIERDDVERARNLLISKHRLSARDAIHAATMERYGIRQILTFDAGFDEVSGIRRISS